MAMVDTRDNKFGELVYDIIADRVKSFWPSQVAKYVQAVNLELTYSKKELNKTLNWAIGEWSLELANVDWGYLYSSGGKMAVLRKLDELADGTAQSAEHYIKEDFGYADDLFDWASQGRGLTPAARLGKQLLEPYEREKDRMFRTMGQDLRASEYTKSRAASVKFVRDMREWTKIEISKAGY